MRNKIWLRGFIPLIPLAIIGIVTLLSAITAVVTTTELAKKRQITSTQAVEKASAGACIQGLVACNTICKLKGGTCKPCIKIGPIGLYSCNVPDKPTPTSIKPDSGNECWPVNSCCDNGQTCKLINGVRRCAGFANCKIAPPPGTGKPPCQDGSRTTPFGDCCTNGKECIFHYSDNTSKCDAITAKCPGPGSGNKCPDGTFEGNCCSSSTRCNQTGSKASPTFQCIADSSCNSGGGGNQPPTTPTKKPDGPRPDIAKGDHWGTDGANCTTSGWAQPYSGPQVVYLYVDNLFKKTFPATFPGGQNNNVFNINLRPIINDTNSHTVRIKALTGQGNEWTLSNSPRSITCSTKPSPTKNPRPETCTGISLSKTNIAPGSSISVTFADQDPQISSYVLQFYNLDNLYGANNPKPIIFGSGNIYSLRSSSNKITIHYAYINRPDKNWKVTDNYPKKFQVNGYLKLKDGRVSAANKNCVKKFNR